MKLEDVTEKIVRIIKSVESCEWASDRSGACSKDCPLWNLTEPGKCCDSLEYLKNEKIKEFSERITNIFREEYPEEMKEQSDDVVVSGDKKETTIGDVVEYLRGMTEKWHVLCRMDGATCSNCKINDQKPEDLCLVMRGLRNRIEEGVFEKIDKILKSRTIDVYPDPKATISSFIQTKIDAAESESEKNEYQEILKHL
jgi:hypothetical protein